MDKKIMKLPIHFLQTEYWEQYGKIETTTISTNNENPLFNNHDIGFAVFFYDEIDRKDFLKDGHLYLITAPNDPNFTDHMMKLTISKNEFQFIPTSSFNNMQPISFSKDDISLNDRIIGKLLFTYHDFNNDVEIIKEGK